MQTAIIIGAGPAGLTAALELLRQTDIKPFIVETLDSVGGLSRTIAHNGNRMDIGGHRLFSKSEKVMNWWQSVLPLQGSNSTDDDFLYQATSFLQNRDGPDPKCTDRVMLLRSRVSQILFQRRLFKYPLALDAETLSQFGVARIGRIGMSYLSSRVHRIHPEVSLQDLLINRFGKELYRMFFQDYTKKVWGVSPHELSAEWGQQRIGTLCLSKAVLSCARRLTSRSMTTRSSERSLTGWFMYPKYGSGQLWEETAKLIAAKGGQINLEHEAIGLHCVADKIAEVEVLNRKTGERRQLPADYVFSTMPVADLIHAIDGAASGVVRDAAGSLRYRDFIAIGVLLKRLKAAGKPWSSSTPNEIHSQWIYIQERDLRLARLQVFNNWSPYMVHDACTFFLGLEYFCSVGDQLWNQEDNDIAALAVQELIRLDMIEKSDVLDWIIVRAPRAYPVHLAGSSACLAIRDYTDSIRNLFLIGRNGTHRYHNIDHSMLTALAAVDNIVNGRGDKANIWDVNTDKSYHE